MARRHLPTQFQKKGISPILLAGSALVVLVVIASFAMKGPISEPAANRSSQIDFVANDFSGKPVRLSDYRGKMVMVNLWASWCPPCRAEMPDLIKYYNDHQAEGLVFLSVNSQDNLTSAQQFVREKQMPFPVLYDPDGKVGQVFRADGLPDTFVIDRSGNLRFTWTGQITPAILDQRVTPLLSQ
ncbi:MAG: TlpA family protein disulfide reductase [Chloroflexi bacterium]|nr:TlpA family protein disulfide reductase [Chloroflexota bacterium]